MKNFAQKEIQHILDSADREFQPSIQISANGWGTKHLAITFDQLEILSRLLEDKQEICHEVCSEGFLPVGEQIQLEYLSKDDDGDFETEKSWKFFINGNFRDGEYFVEGVKESTLKHWCMPIEEYINRFAVHIGGGQYIPVPAEHIMLKYSYELYYRGGSDFPAVVVIFVKANLK